MIRLLKSFTVVSLLLMMTSGLAFASLEWTIEPAIPLQEGAIATVQAADGSRLFVLTASGKILVLNAAGKVESTIPGPFKAETLSVSPDGRRLYLGGKAEKKLQVVSLLERFDIPVGGSPVKGDIAAAVTVAVFSDFQ